MEQQSLSVETRDSRGKGPARRLRASGKLPGVLYGLGKNIPITVDPRTIHRFLLAAGGRNQIFNLAGPGVDGKHALIKDYQVDPVERNLVHVDLLEIDVTKKISVTVPLAFTGKALGVAEGGVLNLIERQIEVKCLPTQIPGHIDVDVTALKIGDSIHLEEVKLPEGIEMGNRMNPTLCTVVPPAKEEEAAPSLTPSAEPEVITAKKAEGEEGETPAAGAAEGKKDKDAEKEKKK